MGTKLSSGDGEDYPLPLDRYRPFPNAGYRNFLQRNLEVPIFLRALRLPKGGRVLEVGCGRGTALPVIQRILSPSSLVGLDIEVRFLFEARAKDVSEGAARLVHGDLRHLPFPNASFDTVIDFGTCYHVGGAEQALREICRVLAPRGVLATESKLAQVLAHPIRTLGRRLTPPKDVGLRASRHAGMWVRFDKVT